MITNTPPDHDSSADHPGTIDTDTVATAVESDANPRLNQPSQARALVAAAAFLSPSDAAVIRALYQHGIHLRNLAQALQQPESTLRRRVSRLLKRIDSPLFDFVIRHAHAWPADRRQLAYAVIIRAETIQSAARRMGLTIHAARLQLLCIRNLCDEQRNRP